MLGSKDKKSRSEEVATGVLNVLGEGTVIDGNLSSNGDLRIDGQVKGDVQTRGKCVLGGSGNVSGNIVANCCDISGVVEGNIKIGDLLLIKSTGKVNGDIKTSKIVIENGGELNGSCTMGGAAPKDTSTRGSDVKQAKA
jgi:cytoskeletal protein CcmA (bactofilin family)